MLQDVLWNFTRVIACWTLACFVEVFTNRIGEYIGHDEGGGERERRAVTGVGVVALHEVAVCCNVYVASPARR